VGLGPPHRRAGEASPHQAWIVFSMASGIQREFLKKKDLYIFYKKKDLYMKVAGSIARCGRRCHRHPRRELARMDDLTWIQPIRNLEIPLGPVGTEITDCGIFC